MLTLYELTQEVYLSSGLLLQAQAFSPFPSSMCRFPRQTSRSATERYMENTLILGKITGQRSVQTERTHVSVGVFLWKTQLAFILIYPQPDHFPLANQKRNTDRKQFIRAQIPWRSTFIMKSTVEFLTTKKVFEFRNWLPCNLKGALTPPSSIPAVSPAAAAQKKPHP